MFETPDFTDLKSALTDVGHTAAGFATLALKRGNDARLDFSKKYDKQIDEFRIQICELVQRADETATELEDRFEPLIAKLTEQLPAPADRFAANAATQTRHARRRANRLVSQLVNQALGTDVADAGTSTAQAPTAAQAPAEPRTERATRAKSATTPAEKATGASKSPVTKTATSRPPTSGKKPVGKKPVATKPPAAKSTVTKKRAAKNPTVTKVSR